MDVDAGQTWVPLPGTVPGTGALRVLCRYQYADPDDGPTWVCERLDGARRLERVTEETLRASWHPSDATAHTTTLPVPWD